MAESPSETQNPVIDVNDPDVQITADILLEHNNPFILNASNHGSYDLSGVNIEPESLAGLFRFDSAEDAVKLYAQVIERSGSDVDPAKFMQQKAEANGTLTEQVSAAIIAVTNPGAAPAAATSFNAEAQNKASNERDQNHPDNFEQEPDSGPVRSEILDYFKWRTNFELRSDVERVHVGVNEVGGWVKDALTGTVVGSILGVDGTPSFYTVPENALEKLWLGAHQPNITDENARDFFSWQLKNMDVNIVFEDKAARDAFLDAAVAKRLEINSNIDLADGNAEIRDFVAHMMSVSEEYGIQFEDPNGELISVKDQNTFVVPKIEGDIPSLMINADGKVHMNAPSEPEAQPSSEPKGFVLSSDVHDEVKKQNGIDKFDDESELVLEAYDKGLDVLTAHAALAIETFVNGLEDGTFSFTRLEAGQEEMIFAADMTWDELKSELGTDAPELRMMKDELGDIYAIRLSNTELDFHVYVDPESFLTKTKAIFEASQDLSQDQTLSTLQEIFNRAAHNIAEPEHELKRELSSGELAANNTLAPPNAA